MATPTNPTAPLASANFIEAPGILTWRRESTQVSYRHGSAETKPCLHPLTSPAGVAVTAYAPADHRWHRGLWCAIKFIDGVNHWEEPEDPAAPRCRQVGLMPPLAHTQVTGERTRVDLRHDLAWCDSTGAEVLTESRTITLDLGPKATVCTWTSVLRSDRPRRLERTPFTTWGGYGGITLRAPPALREVRHHTPTGPCGELIGERQPWCAWDGRIVDPQTGNESEIGVALIPLPSHDHQPLAWYARAGTGYTFTNAAFLFYGGIDLPADTDLTLSLRLVVVDGRWDRERLAWAVERTGA